MCVGVTSLTDATYTHWLTVAKKSAGPMRKRPTAHEEDEWHNEVLGFLISSYWVDGEAHALGIGVSAATVKKTFDHLRNQQFPKAREFRAFLRSSGQTVADLLFRVELNLLSTMLQKRAVRGHHGAAARARALAQFVKRFQAKWEAQTYCTPQYDVPDCGHVQASV